MQNVGLVLAWLSGAAVVGMLLFLGSFTLSITTSGTQAYAPLAGFFNSIAPIVTFVTLASEALALVLLVVGSVCWRSRIFRSRRWVLSGLGVGFVAAVIMPFVYIALVIGVPNI